MKRARRSPLDTFPFGPPKTSPGVPEASWKTREVEWEKTRPQRQRATLERLREAYKEGEHALRGWPAILAWLHDHGFRNREGRSVNERTVRGWSKRLGCPVWRGCRAFASRTRSSPPWTSNYLLLAWAVSLYRSGGPDMPRIERSGSEKPAKGAWPNAADLTRIMPVSDEASPTRIIPPRRGGRMPRYSAPEAGSSPSALTSPTRAIPAPPTPEPAPRPRRFVPPEHGAPPPTRRTVMGPRGDDQGG